MPMQLRKRKAPVNPPPPPPPKKTRKAEPKKTAAAKVKGATETVKKASKKVAAAIEKKEEAPALVETNPATDAKAEAKPDAKQEAKSDAKSESKPEAKADAETVASASNAAAPASAPAPAAPAAPAAKKGRSKAASAKETKETKEAKEADAKADAKDTKADAKATPKLKVGDTLPTDLGEITLDDGSKTTFGALLDDSDKGIVLFSYTKQSTPGCTTQACAFRDNYTLFTSAGYRVYGLSGDSHTDNAKFKAKQNFGYPLISDPTYTFHEKLGIKSTGAKSGTVRSVIVVQKEGAIIKEHKTVTPKNSLDIAKKAVGIEAAAAPATNTTKTIAVPAPAPATAEGEAKPTDS